MVAFPVEGCRSCAGTDAPGTRMGRRWRGRCEL